MNEDFTFTVPGKPEQVPLAGTYSKETWPQMLARVGGNMPSGVAADVLATVADGDRVVVVATTSGTSRSGQQYRNDLCYSLELRDGAIASCREYLDTIHANEALAAP